MPIHIMTRLPAEESGVRIPARARDVCLPQKSRMVGGGGGIPILQWVPGGGVHSR
jgi:hypothetical protein